MGVFNFMETSFIISLGITFVLILLLIYHFKQRLTASESKQDTMFEIINNLAQELNNVKGHVGQLTMMSRPPTPFPFNNVNNDIKFSHEKVTAQNDEPDEESMEDDDYESDDEDRIIVSDDDDEDNISVEELSDDEDSQSQSQSIEVEEVEMKIAEKDFVEETTKPIEKEPINFSKMNLGSLKAYIVEKGLVEDASKMKKAQILTLIQEQQPAI